MSRAGQRSRAWAACAGTSALLALLACAPAVAANLGGGDSFQQQLSEGQTQTSARTTPASTTPTSESSSSNSTTLILGGSALALVLLAGIAYAILRDARRVAPAGDGQLAEERSSRDSAARLRKRRAQARAARKQRKRNR